MISIGLMACLGAWGCGSSNDSDFEFGDRLPYAASSLQMEVPHSLVRRDRDGFHVASWFRAMQPDLLHLIKRSYTITKREKDSEGNGKFRNECLLLSGDQEFNVSETDHEYNCDRNFTGIHGNLREGSHLGNALNVSLEMFTLGRFSPEIDLAGYVAILKNGQYPVIVTVFRGSQGEDFQPGSGAFSASWATNYDASPMEVDPELYGFEGAVHAGYLAKINSCNLSRDVLEAMVDEGKISNPLQSREDLDFIYPLFTSIQNAIDQIPEDERSNIRFVVTGHSQGGGLAQIALPLIINQFKDAIPEFIDNIRTPRFFGYFLSAPRIAADQTTVDNYNAFVGHENMINHFAFRDVVTMACLHGYRTLGYLACDSARDVLHRGICSEIAYNHRMFLFNFLKACINPSAFDMDDDQHWILPENPELIICWDEIKHLLAHQHFTYERINPEGVVDLCNKALDLYRQRHSIDVESHFTDLPFLLDYDWEDIQRICRGDLFPHEIQLNEETCAILDLVVDNIYGNTVMFSSQGRFNIISLVDTAFDLLNAGNGGSNPGGCWECLKRYLCCCCCCCSSPIESTFDFDPEFQRMLESRNVDTDGMGMIRLGGISLIVYLHFGSGANGFQAKLFDKFLPSRNLNLALMNGEIVRTNQYPILYSEMSTRGPLPEVYMGHSDDEATIHRSPRTILKMREAAGAAKPVQLPKCRSESNMSLFLELPH
ncbi:MAG: hypothetical protein LBR92_01440 [Puniceicoccales bacterium]|nr:hypothetical protein [Puniceicoccales bacterium]